jgi:hypothetical protein
MYNCCSIAVCSMLSRMHVEQSLSSSAVHRYTVAGK